MIQNIKRYSAATLVTFYTFKPDTVFWFTRENSHSYANLSSEVRDVVSQLHFQMALPKGTGPWHVLRPKRLFTLKLIYVNTVYINYIESTYTLWTIQQFKRNIHRRVHINTTHSSLRPFCFDPVVAPTFWSWIEPCHLWTGLKALFQRFVQRLFFFCVLKWISLKNHNMDLTSKNATSCVSMLWLFVN